MHGVILEGLKGEKKRKERGFDFRRSKIIVSDFSFIF
jgi:hypothetical protein